MRSLVFTLTAVLLMATLCQMTAAQSWVYDLSLNGQANDEDINSEILDVGFKGNNEVFFGKGDRLYKWDISSGRYWWRDWNGSGRVHSIDVAKNFSVLAVMYNQSLHLRHTTGDMPGIASTHIVGGFGSSSGRQIAIDDDADYVAVAGGNSCAEWDQTVAFGPVCVEVRHHGWAIYDTWGTNGWQLKIAGGADHLDMNAIDILPDGSRVYVADGDRNIDEWTYGPDGKITDNYWGSESIKDIAITDNYSNNSIRVAGVDWQNRLYIWNWSGDLLRTLDSSYYIRDIEFTPNGEILAYCGDKTGSQQVLFWDISNGDLDARVNIPSTPYCIAFSDDGKKMAVGCSDGYVRIYRWTGGSALAAPEQPAQLAPPVTALLENYPNPFNPETWIPYQLAQSAEVSVSIHSADGKLVRTLELGQVPAGVYSDKSRAAYWDGRNAQGEPVASGVYFYTLKAGEFSATKKMLIRK